MVHNFLLGLLGIAAAGVAFAANFKRVVCPDGVHTATNEACCVFFELAEELQNNVFKNICFEEGEFLSLVRGASLRLIDLDDSTPCFTFGFSGCN